MKDTTKTIISSYARTALVAALSVYVAMQGEVFNKEGLEAMLFAAFASISGPVFRALNPNDKAFGKVHEHDPMYDK